MNKVGIVKAFGVIALVLGVIYMFYLLIQGNTVEAVAAFISLLSPILLITLCGGIEDIAYGLNGTYQHETAPIEPTPTKASAPPPKPLTPEEIERIAHPTAESLEPEWTAEELASIEKNTK